MNSLGSVWSVSNLALIVPLRSARFYIGGEIRNKKKTVTIYIYIYIYIYNIILFI